MQTKNIQDYPGYSISSTGQVFGPSGEIKGWITAQGYKRVSLCNEEGSKEFFVHRLVGEAFVEGRTEERKFIDHIDSNKLNNRADNLRWCTQAENIKFAFENGRFPEKLNPKPAILENIRTGEKTKFDSIRAASISFGLPYWHLNEIYNKKGYRRTTHGFTIYPA